MKIEYEYDENKNKQNIDKHKISFEYAYLVYESDSKITMTKYSNNEERLNDIAMIEIDNKVLLLVYIIRSNKIRVISLRTASKAERKLYYEEFSKETK
ncbi:MAG: hypothetical protein RLZZ210_263 [Pseudomonadota bacterium]|jgi:uncharacterized DUF497 family protein